MNLEKNIISGIILVITAIVIVYFIGRKKTKRPLKKSQQITAGNEQVYIGNLHYNVPKNVLFDTFKPFGTIREVRIIQNNKTGRSKGFAFIRFKTANQAEKALKMHGRDLYGRSLVVRIAKQRDET